MNRLAKFFATLGLVPIFVLAACDHELIDAEEYSAVAGDVSTSSIGPITVTSASYLAVCARIHSDGPNKGEPYFRITKATFVTYIEKNGKPGFQDGDVMVGSKGTTNDRPQANVQITSLSSHGEGGLNGDHWQLDVQTDTDMNNDGRPDRLVTHAGF